MKAPGVFEVVDKFKEQAKQLAEDLGTRAAQLAAPEIAALTAHCSAALSRIFDARIWASDAQTADHAKQKNGQ